MPPPEYSGDNPTVPNPVYRDPAEDNAAGSGNAASPPPKKPAPTDVGRRGNIVIGLMLLFGLAVTGAAGVMVSNAGGVSSEQAAGGASAAAATDGSGEGSAELPIAAARPGAEDEAGSGQDEAEAGETGLGAPLNSVPAELGGTVTVLDGVAVTVHPPRPISRSAGDDGPDALVSIEATVINRAGGTHEVASGLQLLGDLDDLTAPTSGGPTVGFTPVDDVEHGVSAAWSGPRLEPGGTAYGLFGFSVPAGAPDEVYAVVWLGVADGDPGYVVFSGTLP